VIAMLQAAIPEGSRLAEPSAPVQSPKPASQPASTTGSSSSVPSLVAERKKSFSAGPSSSSSDSSKPAGTVTAGQKAPSSSLSPRANVPAVKPASADDIGVPAVPVAPTSLADRLQSYQQSASPRADSGAAVKSTSVTSAVSSAATSAAVPASSGLPSLHAGSLSTAEIDAELLAHPLRLEERDSNGRTPLLAACFSKKWEVAKYFIEKGADVTGKDKVSTLFAACTLQLF
jgi:hypothetical protein